ncbi:unnamed protein product [Chrysoparadoxa australica]
MLVVFEEAIIVVFVGSEPFSPHDWIGNLFYGLEATPTPEDDPNAMVHKGIMNHITSQPGHDNWEKMKEEVRSLLGGGTEKKRLYISGHSLGGALAVLAAHQLSYEDKARGITGSSSATEALKRGGVVTFGAPRVGNNEFTESYERRGLSHVTVHYVHGEEFAPRLPPTANFLGGGRPQLLGSLAWLCRVYYPPW